MNVNRMIKLSEMFSPLTIICDLSVSWWIGWYYMYEIKNIQAFQAWKMNQMTIYSTNLEYHVLVSHYDSKLWCH